jgi:hypothetical protein
VEAAPIRYVPELVGPDTDSERAIRWLIALMVLCCDPLATRNDGRHSDKPLLKPPLVRRTFDSCHDVASNAQRR